MFHRNHHEQRELQSNISLIDSEFEMGSGGQLISGVLVLSGQLKQAELIPTDQAVLPQMCHVWEEITNGEPSSSYIGSVWLDSSPWWESPSADTMLPSNDNASGGNQDSRQYILLRLATSLPTGENRDNTHHLHIYEVLALEVVRTSGQYARVGAGFIEKKSWFGELPMETISLI